MKTKIALAFVVLLAACASSPLPPPYPVNIVVDDLPDAFIAGLPGVRAKQLSVDPRTQRGSYRVAVPSDWSFTTGASPGQSVEIYVLAGEIQLGEFNITSGGYAYVPPGHTGLQMQSAGGALMLYFLDDSDDAAVIETPLLTNSSLLDWRAVDFGVSVKDLRHDPGSGARSWLMKVDAGAILPFLRSSQSIEGYLLSGSINWSECSGGLPVTDEYLPGGYFHRPPVATYAGPDTQTTASAVWYLRALGEEKIEVVEGCQPEGEEPG